MRAAVAITVIAFVAGSVGCGVALTTGALVGINANSDDGDDLPPVPPDVAVTTPSGNDIIAIPYRLSDRSGSRAGIRVEYSVGNAPFQSATQAFAEGADGTTNLEAAPVGTDHTFLWNSAADLGFVDTADIRIRITPFNAEDTTLEGPSDTTDPFPVFNTFITSLASRPTPTGATPFSLALSNDGSILVADALGHRVLRIDATTGTTSLIAGTGQGGFNQDGILATSAQLNLPASVVELPAPTRDLLIVDALNGRLRRVSSATGFITTAAGGGSDLGDGILARDALMFPRDVSQNGDGTIFVSANSRTVRVLNLEGVTTRSLPAGTASPFCPNQTFPILIPPAQIETILSRAGCLSIFPMAAQNLQSLIEPEAIVAFGDPTSRHLLYVLEVGAAGGQFSNFGSNGFAHPLPRLLAVNLHDTNSETIYTPLGSGVPPTLTILPGDVDVVLDANTIAPSGVTSISGLADLVLLDADLLLLSEPETNRVHAFNMGMADRTVLGTNVPSGQYAVVAGDGAQGSAGDGLDPLSASITPQAMTVDAAGNLYLGELTNRVRVVTAGGLSFAGQSFAPNTVNSIPLIPPGTVPGIVKPLYVSLAPNGDLIVTDIDPNDPRSSRVFRVSNTDAQLTTLVGSGVAGDSGDGGPALAARTEVPFQGVLDAQENLLVFSDVAHHRVRAVNLSSTSQTFLGVSIAPGEVETVAGDGTASIDSTTLGDGGPPSSATLSSPSTVFFDSTGLLWIGDRLNHRVRVCNPLAAAVTVAGVSVPPGRIQTVVGTGDAGTLADDGDGGPASAAKLRNPNPVLAADGNVWIVDGVDGQQRARVINLQAASITVGGVSVAPGAIATVVGSGAPRAPDDSNLGDSGPALSATFRLMSGLAIRADGLLFVSDQRDHRIRVVNLSDQAQALGGVSLAPATITTILGVGEPRFAGDEIRTAPSFFGSSVAGPVNSPFSLAALPDGRLFFCDLGNGAVRMLNLGSAPTRFAGILAKPGESVVVAGSRSGLLRVDEPVDLEVTAQGAVVFTDRGAFGISPALKLLDPQTRIVTRVAGLGGDVGLGDGGPASLSTLIEPRGIHLDANESVYVADAGTNRVRFVNRQTTSVTVMGVTIDAGHIDTVINGTTGDGIPGNDQGKPTIGPPGTTADVDTPFAVDSAGGFTWVAEEGANFVYRINSNTGVVDGTMLVGPVLGAGTNTGVISATPSNIFQDFTEDFTTFGMQSFVDALVITQVTGGPLLVDGAVAQLPVALIITNFDPIGGNDLSVTHTLQVVGGGTATYRVVRHRKPLALAAVSANVSFVAVADNGGGSVIHRLTWSGPDYTSVPVAGTGSEDWNGDYLTATLMNIGDVQGMAVDGDLLFVTDIDTHRVIAIHTNSGGGTETVGGVTLSPNEARMVAGAGKGAPGFNGDAIPADNALLNRPTGISTALGGVYLVDQGNGRLRRFQR